MTTNKTNVTALELAVLRAIVDSDYGNGDGLTPVWSWDVVRGDKGLLHAEGRGKEATVWLTEAGVEALKS